MDRVEVDSERASDICEKCDGIRAWPGRGAVAVELTVVMDAERRWDRRRDTDGSGISWVSAWESVSSRRYGVTVRLSGLGRTEGLIEPETDDGVASDTSSCYQLPD
jgi:hypothetical protein